MECSIKKACSVWNDDWDGMYIGKLSYRSGFKKCKTYTVSIKSGHLVKLEIASESGERLDIFLLKSKGLKSIKEKRPSKAKFWRSFSFESVKKYSISVGDHNSLHYSENAVVSGFQLLSEVVREKKINGGVNMRFFYPIHCNEKIYLEKTSTGYVGWTDTKCFEVKNV